VIAADAIGGKRWRASPMSTRMPVGGQKHANLDHRQLPGAAEMVRCTETECAESGRLVMASQRNDTTLGKIVFALTGIAMVGFFWWLLIYDHGVVAAG
jgi:hypothetical protein